MLKCMCTGQQVNGAAGYDQVVTVYNNPLSAKTMDSKRKVVIVTGL